MALESTVDLPGAGFLYPCLGISGELDDELATAEAFDLPNNFGDATDYEPDPEIVFTLF